MDLEDSMEPILIDHNDVTIQILNNNDQVDKLFAQGVNISDGMVVHEPSCDLCSSPHREDVEQLYLTCKDYKQTAAFFKQLSGHDIHKSIVENHMRFHYDRAIREIQKVEYIDRIKRYSGQNLTTLDRISICFAILSERLMGINSVIPAEDESVAEIEKLKSSETARLMGQLKDLLKLQAAILGEMKNSGELITIPTNDFINIINEALSQARTDSERKLVKDILGKLDALSRRAS